ncbi:MAG: hypothetical protein ACRDSN_03185 [Pseudonocardiaceae bacterium]
MTGYAKFTETVPALPELVAQRMPYDGPHSPATVKDAARSISALLRYLTNATGPGNGPATLHHAAATHAVLAYLCEASHDLGLLLEHLATATRGHAERPGLYDDRRDRVATQTARDAAGRIEQARAATIDLAAALDRAWQVTSHLRDDQDDQQTR